MTRLALVIGSLAATLAAMPSLAAPSSARPEVSTAAARVCDVDGNAAVDIRDIFAIWKAIGRRASGPDDPRDSNGDGLINLKDLRRCVTRCTLRRCAIATNTAPVADAGPDHSVFVPGTVTLDGSGSSDADGDALSFSWSLVSAPAGSAAALSDPGSVKPTLRVDVAGSYVVELVVNDGTVDSAPDTVSITESPAPGEGVLLPGDPGSPARQATTDFDLEDGVPRAEFSLDDAGREVARTQFEVGFTSEATVGEVNGLLNSIGGRIVSMLEGVLIVVVRIPDPGSLAALETLIANLEASSIVRFVTKSELPAPDELPSNHFAGSADLDKIDHNLSVRAAGAWNARAALDAAGAQKPQVFVADFFGDGPPNADVDVVLAPSSRFGLGQPNSHGYHVLGIISADYGGDTSARGLATGMLPDTIEVGVVDFVVNATNTLTDDRIQDRILIFVQHAPGNVVVSTSFSFGCTTAALATARCNQANATQKALIWIEKVRDRGLENRFLHLTSAGNVNVAGDTDARFNSAFTAARLLHGLRLPGPIGQAVPNLTNTLVIENVMNSPVEPFPPLCLRFTSKRAGDLAGIGTFVHSLTGASAGAGDLSGTSMSTPQVAGLAAYVWSLNPSLTVQEVMAILLSRASAGVGPTLDVGCNAFSTSKPVIDAYASILAADLVSALSGSGPPSNAPARLAILDVADATGAPANADGTPTGNGAFDEHDLELFKQEFAAASGGADFSRFDLNGDGQTGTTGRERFDLDNSGSHEVIAQDIEGSAVSFDESGLTDMQILCYYAYSSLFTGDTTVREGQIGNDCSQPITIKKDDTRIFWQIVDPDENSLCCDTLFLTQDTPPPVSMTLGDGSFVAHRPSPNVLGIDVTATAFNNNSGASSGAVFVRAELAFDGPGTLVVDIDPTWFGTGRLRIDVTILETGESASCVGNGANLSCSPSASVSSPVPDAGTRTVDVSVTINPLGLQSALVSGRAVTISRR